ncbi:MAG: retention module-containing protein, partial [Pseudomonadota bacterium]
MAIIGKIVAMTGTAVALSDNGAKRDLHLGDQIQSSDTIQTGKGVFVDLELSNGRVIHIAAEQLVAFTPDLTNLIAPDALDSAVNVATIDTVIKAIEGGQDINDVLEETAAGNGKLTIHGFDFVNLLRINDDLNRFKFAYEYDTDGRVTDDPAPARDDDRFGLNNLGTPITPNASPVGVVTPVTGAEDGGDIAVNLSGTDPDGTVVSVSVATLPLASQGVLTKADGTPVVAGAPLTPAEASSLVFHPTSNFNGTVNIPFTVTDNQGAVSPVATTPITVTPVNDAPIANNGSITPTEDTTINVPLSGTDVDGTLASYTITAGPTPAQGTLVYDDDGLPGTPPVAVPLNTPLTPAQAATVQFVPSLNYNGPVAPITYTVTDNQGLPSSPATVTINPVTPVNDAPVDGNEANTVTQNATLTVPAGTGLLADTTDVDGGTPSVTSFLVAGNATPFAVTAGTPGVANIAGVGVLTINSDGSYSFAPAPNYVGAIPVVTYTVSDNAAVNPLTDTSTLTLTIGANNPPVDGDENNSITEDVTLTVADGAPGDLLNNATDVDGNPLSITSFLVAGNATPFVVSAGTPGVANLAGIGVLTINANGSYSFAPAANYTGAIPVVTYTVADGVGGTDTSTLSLSINAVNDAPIANNGSITPTEDT